MSVFIPYIPAAPVPLVSPTTACSPEAPETFRLPELFDVPVSMFPSASIATSSANIFPGNTKRRDKDNRMNAVRTTRFS